MRSRDTPSPVEFEIIDIRHFEPEEFAEILAAEGRAWHQELRWDFAGSARIINSCLREKRLAGYALVRSGRIHGYCFFFYDGEKGIIGGLFAHPMFSGEGHERELLEHTLETLLGTPGLRRIEAQLPHFAREELEAVFSRIVFGATCAGSCVFPWARRETGRGTRPAGSAMISTCARGTRAWRRTPPK